MLHIIYRSYGGENKKGRPEYYSKHLALASAVRAFQSLEPGQAELLFLNDGPIPDDRLRLMEQSGEIIARSQMGLRGSMRNALALPSERGWPADDLVWLAEDDYLYLPQAFSGLLAAASAFPEADYFGLYARIGDRLPNGMVSVEERLPRSWSGSEPVAVLGHPWRRALSVTSTFGARVKPLIEDRAMMHRAMQSGGAWDETTCLIYQGHFPYPLATLMRPFQGFRDAKGGLVRNVAAMAVRAGMNVYPPLRALTGVHNRVLVAPDPALSTHLETAYLSTGTDWSAFAADMQTWLGGRKAA
ncbi:hypothetical protein BH10PSE17_BH10PSE17_05690 [soil metagenome]